MSKNLLTVASPSETGTIFHNDGLCVEVHCYPCRKFRLAVRMAGEIAVEQGIETTFSQRDDKVVFNHVYFHAFCNHCQDGVNERLESSLEWITSHITRRHSN